MQTQDALKLLIEAVNLAQSRGAYNLKEAATILPAVETFTNNNQETTMNEEGTNPNTITPIEAVPQTPTTPESNDAVVEAPAVEVEAPVEAGEAEAAPSEAGQ